MSGPGVGGAPQPDELEPEHTEGFKVRRQSPEVFGEVNAHTGIPGWREEDD